MYATPFFKTLGLCPNTPLAFEKARAKLYRLIHFAFVLCFSRHYIYTKNVAVCMLSNIITFLREKIHCFFVKKSACKAFLMGL